MNKAQPVFIIYAPRYDDTSGGSIVLHKLCHLINLLGEKAYLWPMGKPLYPQSPLLPWFAKAIAYYLSRIYRKNYSFRQDFLTPLWYRKDISKAVIIYPEIIDGNPLGANFVVRWLLNKPGFFSDSFHYSKTDMFFYYQDAFLEPNLQMINGGQLFVIEFFRDIYWKWNHAQREDSCYIIRKGKSRSDLPKLKNLVVVDGLSHKQTANVFNRCKYCFSYDLHTMYMTYSALCGCIPVVVPLNGISKEEWQPVEKYRYGIAYGLDNVDYALSTRDLLLSRIHDDEKENLEMVSRFISVVNSNFNISNDPLGI